VSPKKINAKKRSKAKRTPSPKTADLRYESCTVSYENVKVPGLPELPEAVVEKMSEMYKRAERAPEKNITEILQLLEEFPENPQLLNQLAVAYFYAGRDKEGEETVLRNYEANPKYFFARLNYADLCIRKGDFKKIPEIFDHTYTPRSLYPEREIFHVSEIFSFSYVMGIYFVSQGDLERGRMYLDMLKRCAPNHPKVQMLEEPILALESVKDAFFEEERKAFSLFNKEEKEAFFSRVVRKKTSKR
jgi:tetratricopeptide (TPR) repeat protein